MSSEYTPPSRSVNDVGGVIVVTRFTARRKWQLVVLRLLHPLIKRRVSKQCTGLIGATSWMSWRELTMYSVSAWESVNAVYDLGNVDEHIRASRIPVAWSVETRCGIFAYSGEWKQLMFGGGKGGLSPLDRNARTGQSDG